MEVKWMNENFISKSMRSKYVNGRRNSVRVNEKGETPLHVACINGNMNEVATLLKKGVLVNIRDNSGWTPLHEASNFGNYDIVKILLEAGALVNDFGGKHCGGTSPIMDAAENGHYEVVELLVEHGADILQKDIKGRSCIDRVIHRIEDLKDSLDDVESQDLFENLRKTLGFLEKKASSRTVKNSPNVHITKLKPFISDGLLSESIVQPSNKQWVLPDATFIPDEKPIKRLENKVYRSEKYEKRRKSESTNIKEDKETTKCFDNNQRLTNSNSFEKMSDIGCSTHSKKNPKDKFVDIEIYKNENKLESHNLSKNSSTDSSSFNTSNNLSINSITNHLNSKPTKPIRLKIQVKDKLLLIPINDLTVTTVMQLIEKVINRYHELTSHSVQFNLKTKDGAYLFKEDLLSDIIDENDPYLIASPLNNTNL